MMQSDKSRFSQQTQALQTELQSARARIRELEEKAQDAAPINLEEFFTVEQIETLGEEQAMILAQTTIKQAKRIAHETIQAEVEPLRKKQTDDEADKARAKQHEFLLKLTELAPHWEAVNVDPRWLAFLETREPHSGIQRQLIIDYAQAEGNAQRVADLIASFEATLNPVAVPAEPARVPQGHAAQGHMPQPAPAQGHPTKFEIRDFYKRKAIGRISPQEVQTFEARMTAARAAGVL
jgi:hypothetical protein